MADLDRIKSRLVLIAILGVASFAGGATLHAQWAAWRDGGWSRRLAALERPRPWHYRRALGERWAWIEAIREHTPEDALVALHFPPPAGPALAQSLMTTRYLAYPRRIEPDFVLRRWINEDIHRLDRRVFGLMLDESSSPDFPEHWKERARGPGWRLLQWDLEIK